MPRALRVVLIAAVAAGACFAAVAPPSSAGGSSWVFEREHFQPGDTVFVWAQVAWAHNPSLGTPDDGPYRAYVVPSSPDALDGHPLDGAATPVGELVISLEPYETHGVRFGPHHATLTFTMPNLPPGQYLLVNANAEGTFVGDLIALNTFWIDAPVVRGVPTFTG